VTTDEHVIVLPTRWWQEANGNGQPTDSTLLGPIMRKLLAMGVLTFSIASFGTCWAQNTASPPQIQPPAKTAPTQASHSSRSSVQQYKTEADAKSHCGTDQVVWGNTSSHVLHDSGTKYYGKTTHGAYMCKGLAVNAGYHESKE